MPDIFIDTDVAFDIISKRQPHYISSVRLLKLAAEGKIRMIISEASLATLIYLAYDIYKIQNATANLLDFVNACELIHANKQIVDRALRSGFKDKEDALQYFSALNANAEYFVTRNIKDFRQAETSLPVLLPNEFIQSIENL
jgi:predicted nucleic acid-binding protein